MECNGCARAAAAFERRGSAPLIRAQPRAATEDGGGLSGPVRDRLGTAADRRIATCAGCRVPP